MSVCCKKCDSVDVIKSGIVREKQRYQCRACRYYFTQGDRRVKKDRAAAKALCFLLYSCFRGTFRGMSQIFGVSHVVIYKWVRKEAESIGEPQISSEIQEVEIDEMWHFLKKKKRNDGSSRQWIAGPVELSPGLSVSVILQRSNDSMRNSST